MTTSYLIIYKLPGQMAEYFEIVGGYSPIYAIGNAYEAHPTERLVEALFRKMIDNMTVEDAVQVFNSISADLEILKIYEVGERVYYYKNHIQEGNDG